MVHPFDFPQYRKLLNGKSYYKIETPAKMIEIQLMGTAWIYHRITAKILPERLLIQDLLNNEGARWQVISADEYHAFENDCRRHRQLLHL